MAEFIDAEPVDGRVAAVLPGGNYGVDGPLLMYSRIAATRRGARIASASWDLDGRLPSDELPARVVERAVAAVDELGTTGAPAPLIIAKSLGSFAAPLAADRRLPAVWLTPLLRNEQVVAALRQSTAPCLLVGGTADTWWNGELARSITPHVLKVQGADHGLFPPGRSLPRPPHSATS